MSRKLLATALITCLTGTVNSASANDIIDFLRAINGVPDHDHRAHVPVRQVSPYAPVSHRVARHPAYDVYSGRDFRTTRSRYRSYNRPVTGRSGVSFHVSYGSGGVLPPAPVGYPVGPVAPALPAPPAPGSFGHLPHQLGQVVTCHVPLEPHVRYEDLCDIAPGAVPTIIAVRDPHLGRFRSRGCVEQLVYVQVMAPPCPVQRVRVSPCKTRIRLDYGKYEICITSRNDCVVVSYND